MANIYERLVEAGAPAIVEPRFYRIYEALGEKLMIELRERRPRGGSNLLQSYAVQASDPEEVLQEVVEAAQLLVDRQKSEEIRAEIVGEHSAPAVPFN